MGNNTLEILISMLNVAINSLHDRNINVIDSENPDFRLDKVHYDSNLDEVVFTTSSIEGRNENHG